MYAKYFDLRQEPFSIAPDPRYLFMSARHREALAHLLYGINGGGGFVLLTGEIGAGKTTVCRCFLEQIPRRCNVAYIFNPKQTVIELLQSICDEFRIPYRLRSSEAATVKDFVDPLNEFLLRTHAVGQNNVLIIDEAQNLSVDVLEQLRLLTNLETSERKLLQIVLIGQPELRTMLARPELEQLAQRVIARYHLLPLSEAETSQYIWHRLSVAGKKRDPLFDVEAIGRIHHHSRGVPRRINLLCDRALLGAYASSQAVVDRTIVDKAAAEVFGDEPAPRRRARWRRLAPWPVAGAALAALAAGSLLVGWRQTMPWAQERARPAGAPPALKAAAAHGMTAAAVSPPRAASAAVPADALQWLRSQGPVADGAAWAALARGWQWSLAPGAVQGDPCDAAPSRSLRCFSSDGGLALIRQLDRPALITVHDGNRSLKVLLSGVGDQTATLSLGASSQTVTLSSLASLWHGDFVTLWRPPPGYRGKITAGQGGAAVDWLAAHLAQWQGEAAPAPGARMDQALRERLSAFQVAQGLKSDAVAGPVSLMVLNRATGVAEPALGTARP